MTRAVLRNYSIRPTRAPADIRDEATQHRSGAHPEALADAMAGQLSRKRHKLRWRVGHVRTERHVWASAVVMTHPCPQDRSQVRLRQRYQPVQALASNRSDHPLADRIGLRAVRWRLEHDQAKIPDRMPVQTTSARIVESTMKETRPMFKCQLMQGFADQLSHAASPVRSCGIRRIRRLRQRPAARGSAKHPSQASELPRR